MLTKSSDLWNYTIIIECLRKKSLFYTKFLIVLVRKMTLYTHYYLVMVNYCLYQCFLTILRAALIFI